MRVAALYDIHGNLPALEAILEAMRGKGVDQVFIGGDIVPGPMPRECITLLLDLDLPVRFIRGNGENDILAVARGSVPTRVPEPYRETMGWVADQLPPEHLAAFESWPLTAHMDIEGLGRVLFCHATPRDDNEIFTRLTPEERLRPIFDAAGADIVICGHTHMPFDRTIGDVRVVNAGSVGMPFGEPGAYWALLDSAGSVELRRADYDVAAAQAQIRAMNVPGSSEFEILHPTPEAQMLEIFEVAAVNQGISR